MDIQITPEQYVPKYDSEKKVYSDKHLLCYKNGVICPCTPNKTYSKRESFNNHWKSQRHQNWIKEMNSNSSNYYKECLDLNKLVKQQQKILSDLENKLKAKDGVISYLELKIKNLENKNTTEIDLLTF